MSLSITLRVRIPLDLRRRPGREMVGGEGVEFYFHYLIYSGFHSDTHLSNPQDRTSNFSPEGGKKYGCGGLGS